MKKINQLREGDRVSEIYLCKNKINAKTKAGKTYYSLTLQDSTGTVDGKMGYASTQAFDEAYKKASGASENPNQFAADAYDCVKAIAQAIEAAGLTPDQSTSDLCDALIAQFTDPSFTYSGLTGDNMTWSTTGEVTKDPKGMVIENGIYMPLDA